VADSTSNIDELASAQAQKDVTINDYFRAASRGADWGRRATSSGLNWNLYGSPRLYVDATAVTKASFTVVLTGSSTRFVSVDRALAAVQVATAFDADKYALWRVVTGASSVTSYEDHRDPHHLVRFLYGRLTKAMGDANVTLTYAEAMCESIECTGSNSSLRDLIVPAVPRAWSVFANTTTNGVRVIAASGTGTTIAVGKTAIVEFDGTNVRRITNDSP
jgi:hypothetical protein